MTKLHELKIKYEQSELAERAAWGVWVGQCAKGTNSSSSSPLSPYRRASEEWYRTSDVLTADGLGYHNEVNRRSYQMSGLILWSILGVFLAAVALIVWV